MKPDIKQLVDKFWAGTSSLQEEQELKHYLEDYGFEEQYPELYAYFGLIENETARKLSSDFKDTLKDIPNRKPALTIEKKPPLEQEESPSNTRQSKAHFKYWLAASILLTSGIFTLQKFEKDRQIKEAQVAFNEAKYSLGLLSENMNKGASYLKQVEQFSKTQTKVKKALKK